jgi:hypothetical protein
MHVGIQLTASEGYRQLLKGEAYSFLKNDTNKGRVYFVHFSGASMAKPQATLFSMPVGDFENGLQNGHIAISKEQSHLPPWLSMLEGINPAHLDILRPHAKESHQSRVDKRFLFIAEAVRDSSQIFAAEDPGAQIHRYARACSPHQNESRFRLWYLTYLCFGRNIWSLLPSYCRIGHWERSRHETKFGRPSLARGQGYGHAMTPQMVALCVKGYEKYRGLGVTLTNIFQKTMHYVFGCRTTTSPTGMKAFVHPEGSPFPTFEQFRYQIKKGFGLEQVQKTLYGAARHRSRLAPSKGNFSQEVANLMERIEADGYYLKERPRGFIEGSALPPICVVRSKDVLSGYLVGIGFSFGKEHSSAYRMMLFCMVVGKQFFCSLFGMEIGDEEWISQGLTPYFRVDRGPGAKYDLIKDFEQRFPIRDLAPSWSGQSKATVESSHPRDIKLEGEPTFIQSDLSPVSLAIREIFGTLRHNHSADMSNRIQPCSEMIMVTPTPSGIWNYYDGLLRTEAQPMALEEAVRTFLTPTKFTVKKDGIWFRSQRYDSDALREAGILNKVASSTELGISGFILDFCIRHIWVEIDGHLLMLDAKLKIRDDENVLYMSLAELDQWHEQRSKINSEFVEHQHAVGVDYRQRFEEQTGLAWDAGRRKSGKPAKDATARQESLEAAEHMSNRRTS